MKATPFFSILFSLLYIAVNSPFIYRSIFFNISFFYRLEAAYMKITSNLKALMKNKQMTYDDIQFTCNVSPQTIARASDERIVTCTIRTLQKIADALGVEVNQLYSIPEPSQQENTK